MKKSTQFILLAYLVFASSGYQISARTIEDGGTQVVSSNNEDSKLADTLNAVSDVEEEPKEEKPKEEIPKEAEPEEAEPKEAEPKEEKPKEEKTKEEKTKEAEPKEEKPKEAEPKEEKPKEAEPKEEKPKEEKPKEAEPKEEKPKEEKPKEEKTKEAEPKEEKPKEEKPKEAEPKEEKPKEAEPKEEKPKEEKPKEAEPKEEKPKEEKPKEEKPKGAEPKEEKPKEEKPKEEKPKEEKPKEAEPKEEETKEEEQTREELQIEKSTTSNSSLESADAQTSSILIDQVTNIEEPATEEISIEDLINESDFDFQDSRLSDDEEIGSTRSKLPYFGAVNKNHWQTFDYMDSSDSLSISYPTYNNKHPCNHIDHMYKHKYNNYKISLEVCKINVTQHENLAHDCKGYLNERNEDILYFNNEIMSCESDKSAIQALITDIKLQIATCDSTFKDLQTKVTEQQRINCDLLTSNLGLADKIGFCQDDVYDCQVDINTCLDSCSY